MKTLSLIIIANLAFGTAVHAASAKDVNCIAKIAQDSENKDLKNAPKIQLTKKSTSLGNDFSDMIKRGDDTYRIRVSIQQDLGDESKILIDYSIQKHGTEKDEVPVITKAGFDRGLNVYYGEDDLLVSCNEE